MLLTPTVPNECSTRLSVPGDVVILAMKTLQQEADELLPAPGNQPTEFAYTKPDGWQYLKFTGTATELIRRVTELLQKRLQAMYEPGRVEIKNMSGADEFYGKTFDDQQAAEMLNNGLKMKAQLIVGKENATGPGCEMARMDVHRRDKEETSASLQRYLSRAGLADDAYELPG